MRKPRRLRWPARRPCGTSPTTPTPSFPAKPDFPGLGLFLWAFWRSYSGLSKIRSQATNSRASDAEPCSCRLRVLMSCIGAFFLSIAYSGLLYAILGISAAYKQAVRKKRQRNGSRPNLRRRNPLRSRRWLNGGARARASRRPLEGRSRVRSCPIDPRNAKWRSPRFGFACAVMARWALCRLPSRVCDAADLRRIEALGREMAPVVERDPTSAAKYTDYDHWVPFNVARVAALGLHHSKPLRILDIGCGPGYFLAVGAGLRTRLLWNRRARDDPDHGGSAGL